MKNDAKFEEELTCRCKMTAQFDELWPEHSKFSKGCPLIGSFWQKHIMCELKNTEELCLMALEIDAKFGGN